MTEEMGMLQRILFETVNPETSTDATTRSLAVIAADIRAHWSKPYFGAVPYLDAMSSLQTVSDNYGMDTAHSVVLYFLSNATTWRGEDARRIKAELKKMIK